MAAKSIAPIENQVENVVIVLGIMQLLRNCLLMMFGEKGIVADFESFLDNGS